MASDSSVVREVVISKCKDVFTGMNSLVDVGGSIGIMAKAIVETFPDLKCWISHTWLLVSKMTII
ncbi:conserved hypothetical protein [Ricinus communis]|uniref:O-methyltransferase C-terminal domain-containing protein n=1 Tax=Ricinus communis TaxID=3988 RepID=B9SGP5_RICCO|nr:conserved hypothetical protein [Ricinus communis]